MRPRPLLVASVVVLLLVALGVGRASAILYCNRPYAQLTKDPGRPYNAVGYLNNGCTAFLIDAQHIVAAAHCFEDTTSGSWQQGLRFYPNFHPDRVAADEAHVPRADVLRAVVGSRAGESVLGPGMDWGIARLGGWKDAAGLDLTPLALAAAAPAMGMALVNPAYTRHHFPYDDNDAVTWDNMEWDTTYCGHVKESAPGKNDGGMWAIRMRTPPIYDGVHREKRDCNFRWAPGIVHADCAVAKVLGDVVYHNCDTAGGSSGSPIMSELTAGSWAAIAVAHGPSVDFALPTPKCTNDTPDQRINVGASVVRFRDAPRFASNVAVFRRPDNASATAVFAVDADMNRVVYRYRTGTPPTYDGPFSYWESLGTPVRGAALTRVAACAADATSTPQVFVVVGGSMLYSKTARPDGSWTSWSAFGIPPAVDTVADVDAATDEDGRCQLFVVADGGNAFTRSKSTDTAWGEWSTVATGAFRRISALRYDGTLWAAMVDTSGHIWRTSQSRTRWVVPRQVPGQAGVAAWADVDMTWDEGGRGFMVALPSAPTPAPTAATPPTLVPPNTTTPPATTTPSSLTPPANTSTPTTTTPPTVVTPATSVTPTASTTLAATATPPTPATQPPPETVTPGASPSAPPSPTPGGENAGALVFLPFVGRVADAGPTAAALARGLSPAAAADGANILWFLPMYGDRAWEEWWYFETHLWAPGATLPQDAPRLVSVTATRWMEDEAGVTSPVIFATGDEGNVYFVEYARVGTPRWVLDWKSFYHETIAY